MRVRRPDLGGRLQLGISRGSLNSHRGLSLFWLRTADGTDQRTWHGSTRGLPGALKGDGFAEPNPDQCSKTTGLLRVEPHSNGLRERIWWGAGPQDAEWAAEQGMNLMSSTLLSEDTGVPFTNCRPSRSSDSARPGPIRSHGTPRVSVSRSIFPIVSDLDARILDTRANRRTNRLHRRRNSALRQDLRRAAEQLIAQLANDEAIASADTLLLTIPNQLGVDYCAHVLETLLSEVAPTLGWR